MTLFELDDHVATHSHRTPSHAALFEELSILLTAAAPPFIYVYDHSSPRLTTAVVRDLVTAIPGVCCASVNAITTFTARLFYDNVLNSLAGHAPSWKDGCRNWADESSNARWNENADGFLHGIRTVARSLAKHSGKRNAKFAESGMTGPMVILVENAEKLENTVPELIVILSRLRELSLANVTVIFTSTVQWGDIRPEFGAALEPYYIDVLAPNKEALVQQLVTAYLNLGNSVTPDGYDPNTYHDSLAAMYKQYIASLVDVCYATTRNPDEIAYVAAACWPGYVKPVLELYYSLEGENIAQEQQLGMSIMPDEHTRLRLLKLFTPTFHSALQTLLPRIDSASSWTRQNWPPDDILSHTIGYKLPTTRKSDEKKEDDELTTLPKMAKYLLVASYVASTNPARTDVKMFERGKDEKLKKRRNRGPSKKPSASGKADKVPQRLMGPAPFSVDRLLAILGALLENNDVETRLQDLNFGIAGEETDMEVMRVGASGLLTLLISLRLLHRASATEKLDGAASLKCGISYETALGISRQLKLDLADMIWETT